MMMICISSKCDLFTSYYNGEQMGPSPHGPPNKKQGRPGFLTRPLLFAQLLFRGFSGISFWWFLSTTEQFSRLEGSQDPFHYMFFPILCIWSKALSSKITVMLKRDRIQKGTDCLPIFKLFSASQSKDFTAAWFLLHTKS